MIRRFHFELVGMISLDRNDREIINLLSVSPILFHLNILKIEKILQFWNKKFQKRAWHVIPAQEVKDSSAHLSYP